MLIMKNFSKNLRLKAQKELIVKNKAFTLAEVLITLTIIGVIAALTIPNLMQSYKKHQVEVKLKKDYAMLSQAFKIAQSDNNMTPQDIIDEQVKSGRNMSGEYFVQTYLMPYMKVNKYCGRNITDSVCKINLIKSLTNTNETVGYNWNWDHQASFVLDNGTRIGAWYWPAFSFFLLTVDIDGPKGKNQAGDDVFYFIINNEGLKTLYSPGWGWQCSLNETGNTGFACAHLIMQNGWKIPDDYPIKKF